MRRIGSSYFTAQITPQGQVTIPSPLRRAFNIKAGDKLEIDEIQGVLCLLPLTSPKADRTRSTMFRTQVYLTRELIQTIQLHARHEGKPRAQMIRELIDRGLAERKGASSNPPREGTPSK